MKPRSIIHALWCRLSGRARWERRAAVDLAVTRHPAGKNLP